VTSAERAAALGFTGTLAITYVLASLTAKVDLTLERSRK
jgi:hypothetical protein